MSDLIIAQTKAVWAKIAKRYKINRNIKIKVALVHPFQITKGFSCDGVGFGLIKNPQAGQIVAIVRATSAKLDDPATIPHALAHIACLVQPELGHGYQHDEGFTMVHSWVKENT